MYAMNCDYELEGLWGRSQLCDTIGELFTIWSLWAMRIMIWLCQWCDQWIMGFMMYEKRPKRPMKNVSLPHRWWLSFDLALELRHHRWGERTTQPGTQEMKHADVRWYQDLRESFFQSSIHEKSELWRDWSIGPENTSHDIEWNELWCEEPDYDKKYTMISRTAMWEYDHYRDYVTEIVYKHWDKHI